MYNRYKTVAVSVITFALNVICFYYLSRWFGVKDPWFIAWGLIMSLFIHELGHAIVFESFGIKTTMVFALIAAGVGPGKGYEKKFESLQARKKAAALMAGVVGNIVVILVCGLAKVLGIMSEDSFLRMASLNGGLIAWNLLPVGITDGGRFILLFFESIKENEEPRYERALEVASVCALLAVFIASRTFNPWPIFLLVRGIRKKASQDDPAAAFSRKRLTTSERFFWVCIWLGLLVLGFALSYSIHANFIRKG